MSHFGPGFLGNGDGAPVPGNDAFTKILLHMDGANGGTTFTDVNAGGSAHTWTPTNATTSTITSKFGTSSMLVAAGGLQAPASGDFNVGGGSFTVDLWINRNGNTGQMALGSSNIIGAGWLFQINSSNLLEGRYVINNSSPAVVVSNSTPVPTTGWHHAAYIRNGSSSFACLDGIFSSAAVDGNAAASASGNAGIGTAPALGTTYTGYIDEFRLSVGIARWTSNFVPPTGPYS